LICPIIFDKSFAYYTSDPHLSYDCLNVIITKKAKTTIEVAIVDKIIY